MEEVVVVVEEEFVDVFISLIELLLLEFVDVDVDVSVDEVE